jgi:hypothetical protein
LIYFIQATGGGPIKIGTTCRLTERLRYLRRETGEDLVALAVMDGGRKEEKALHRRFAHLRVEKYALSERFHPGDDLLDFIAVSGRPWEGSDEAPKRPSRGTLIRVTDEFAEVIRTASSFQKSSIIEYADAVLLPLVQQRYRDVLIREATRLEGS